MQFVSGPGSSGSGSSSGGGDHERIRAALRQRNVPANQIPVTVGTPLMLGRTDELAVAVTELRVYRNGVSFTLSARCRGEVARRGEVSAGLSGHRHPRRDNPAEPFLLGFEFSDGRSVTNLSGWPPALPDPDDDGPWLSNGGGGGSDRSADYQFFLSPLPPGDTLLLIAAWPSFGIPENRHVIDATSIRAAAEHVVELWPIEDDGDHGPDPVPPPVVPPGSWFDRN